MDESIMFDNIKTTRQQSSGIQEYPFCPQRPDQVLTEDEKRMLDELSDEEDVVNNINDDDQETIESQFDDKSNAIEQHQDQDVGASHFWNDGASTIATNDNNSYLDNNILSKSLALDQDVVVDDKTQQHVPISPRSKFLVTCLKDRVNPRASLITRRHVSHELKLQHLGILLLVLVDLQDV